MEPSCREEVYDVKVRAGGTALRCCACLTACQTAAKARAFLEALDSVEEG